MWGKRGLGGAIGDSWVRCGVNCLAYGTVSRRVARSSSCEKWLHNNRGSCIRYGSMLVPETP